MANTQTITPSVGQGVVYTAQGPGLTPGYSAIDDRRAAVWGPQEGVIPTEAGAGTGWECVERAAGANSQIQVNANLSLARVLGDSVTAQWLYTVAPHSAVVLLDITAAHATLPRVDQVILEVLDNVHDASGSSLARLRIVDGTATSGATLDNRLGATALPSNAIRLCDMLVDANGSGTVTMSNSKIRDRRPWARGAKYSVARTSGDYTTTSTSNTVLDSTNLNFRIECSGAPMRLSLLGRASNSGTNYVYAEHRMDGAQISGLNTWIAQAGSGIPAAVDYIAEFTPTAGSHRFAPYWSVGAGTGTLNATSGVPLVFAIEELVRQNAYNNSTTSG